MQDATTLKEYRKQLREALENDFQRQALDNFAVAYRTSRANAFADIDAPELIAEIAAAKDESIGRLEELFQEFKRHAEAAGTKVHLAATAHEANEIIARIGKENNVKTIVKSKSMTAEETHLNDHLEAQGFEVTETDLGEWIIQLRHEGPTHMVMPAIHLSRYQVADLFSEVTHKQQDVDIQKLVKVARRELRPKFCQADMGISGANFAIAATGTIGLITNEGNGRLTTTLPRVHVALAGVDKLMPTLHDALRIIRCLPKNATGQAITSYVTWITGTVPCEPSPRGTKVKHVVFLDNGRLAMARDPEFKQVLRCIRCGACANVCPIYRLVGGHKYGHVYIGAIGLVATYFFHGREKAKNLVQNCLNCGACKAVCAAGIDLPTLIKEVHARIQDEEGHPLYSTAVGQVLKNRKLFHTMLKSARLLQKPITGGTPYLRHLPMFLFKDQDFRALPAVADEAFRDKWERIKPRVADAKLKVALFSGCVQDFVYPEQMEAAVAVIASKPGVAMEYPMGQSCCGLPLQMMGEKQAGRELAAHNMNAIDAQDFDYIVTMCASCASYLKHGYKRLFADDPAMAYKAAQFAHRVIDFSSFVRDVLGITDESFTGPSKKVTYHAPCHLCRGLGVTEAPRALLGEAGLEYVPATEEDVCCGFGGTFSVKFPELSKELLGKKLANLKATGATAMATDCPGCIMQIRGGFEAEKTPFEVRHVAEYLAERLKRK
ncbi:L-lactate dehydrogenase (quinone) large subunit LdhH [Solidesulfovibrio magneticus]|uniref:Iron-sulfur binding protein n=1 Tax=Solidesulfovibrio magneticus (strain ATCC 700980 / DSM 13731 / RS-1) TaxID=573370 RepID=C4XRE6_SOLM1|nr:LUD domain-containing protein [Solidesulfovibrio magneticus]BAH75491.1 iron-sulfur binding protein [Solidesulfovibrio magneticus RS-1]